MKSKREHEVRCIVPVYLLKLYSNFPCVYSLNLNIIARLRVGLWVQSIQQLQLSLLASTGRRHLFLVLVFWIRRAVYSLRPSLCSAPHTPLTATTCAAQHPCLHPQWAAVLCLFPPPTPCLPQAEHAGPSSLAFCSLWWGRPFVMYHREGEGGQVM